MANWAIAATNIGCRDEVYKVVSVTRGVSGFDVSIDVILIAPVESVNLVTIFSKINYL